MGSTKADGWYSILSYPPDNMKSMLEDRREWQVCGNKCLEQLGTKLNLPQVELSINKL